MKFFKLANGDVVLDRNILIAFQVTTGIRACDAPDLYDKFLEGLSVSGYAKLYFPTVIELVLAGHNTYAYALYRDQNSGTLLDAKKAVESMLETVEKH